MAAQTGLTIVKKFTYRGNASEEFSNTYHFTGSVPADATAWKALSDALILQEKTLYLGSASAIRAYGYNSDADDAVAVWSWDYLAQGTSVPGTIVTGTGSYPAGDQAGWVRWKTSRLNTKGKAIYLRKYFHAVPVAAPSGATTDQILPAWTTAANAFAAKLHDGTFLDGRLITARAHTDVVISHSASTWITTRTLKRRGKRPGS
jgi:hypothetical protein